MRILAAMGLGAMVLGAVAMTGCAGPTESAQPVAEGETGRQAATGGALPAPVAADVGIVIGAAQEGQKIDVEVGRRFAVALVGVPTAGYLWAPLAAPDFLSRAGEGSGPTTAAQNQPGFTGGSHWEILYFVATGPGEGQLVLAQRRPWETTEPATDSFAVTIRAR